MEVPVQRRRRDLEGSQGIPSTGQFARLLQSGRFSWQSGFSSDRFQVAFIRYALVRLAAALNPVLRFAAVLGKLPENGVVTSRGRQSCASIERRCGTPEIRADSLLLANDSSRDCDAISAR